MPDHRQVKAVIIVPAFNESATIKEVLTSLPKRLKGIKKLEIIVVDDGSVDNTYEIAKEIKINLLHHIINRGLGAAIKTGMVWAKKHHADVAVTFDSDGQHNSKDIQRIIDALFEKKADLVIGSRFLKFQKVPIDRLILNWIANLSTFFLTGSLTTDSQSGLRAFSKKAINLIDIKSDRMEFSSEIILEAKKHNLKIAEVPIQAIYTPYSRSKGQKNLNAIPVFTRFIIRLLR